MTKFIFFSGKGGVGKTSLSSATAVLLASRGFETLLVTTDPASNLGDVFGQDFGLDVRAVDGVEHLHVQEISPQESLRQYKERALSPLRDVFPEDMLRSIEEKMSGPCTEEIATFDQFIACMHKPQYEYVIFDTAPTGHTLRLLELPGSWSAHIEESAKGSGQTCIGGVDALASSKEQYDTAILLLTDRTLTTFVFVTQASAMPIQEMIRSSSELQNMNIKHQVAIINGVIPEEERNHPYSARRWQKQLPHIEQAKQMFHGPVGLMPLYADEVKGIEMLRTVGRDLQDVFVI
ncbi:ArsA family ATPase [Fodinisporobacter ferrooxydans]|uniref:ArsA family ATPase n=1 Tax=Fodinisporobacter ferrooxydans TaxID=2901836 RepID=A0ABY4CHN3_9BACL|nr:ArsA family ATPase [Alicyclobacillaceae bacterium MYW30-H2]